MKVNSFRRYHVYHWYTQLSFVFCPREWHCSHWWAGPWAHLETSGWMEGHTCALFTPCSTKRWVMGQDLNHASQGWELRSVPGAFLPGHTTRAPSWPLWAGRAGGLHWGGCCLCSCDGIHRERKCRRRYFEAVPPSVALREAEQLSGGISLFHMAVLCKYSIVNKDLPGN